MADRAIRFAIGSPECYSSSWVVWSNRDDVYIAARRIAGQIKVSLHASGIWRLAFTQQYADRPGSLVKPGEDRLRKRWRRPLDKYPGVTQAFAVVVPGGETKAPDIPMAASESKKIRWFDPPPTTDALQFTVALLAPTTKTTGWPGKNSPIHPTQDVGHFGLPNGEIVWVTVHQYRMPPSLREKVDLWRGTRVIRESVPVDGDLRATLFGSEPDGLRWFVDLSMPLHPARR